MQEGSNPRCGALLHGRSDVAVDIEGDADPAVPQPLGDHLRVLAPLEWLRRVRVPQTVNVQRRQVDAGVAPAPLDPALPLTAEPLGVTGGAVGCRDHQRVIPDQGQPDLGAVPRVSRDILRPAPNVRSDLVW